MHRNVNSLIGYHLEATDGDMGKVEEFYFDDQAWVIVYLIVKMGNWLSGRKVLISPYALISGMDKPGTFPVNLTRQQVRDSPDISTDQPVYRQQEIALHRFFPWQSYWTTPFYEGGIWGIVQPPPADPIPAKEPDVDLHLRSTHAVSGYHIETTDGQLGHLKDFIIDDQTWHIECLVVEMHNWLMGKKVLIARKHIMAIQWDTSKVLVDMTMDELKNSPVYDESTFLHAESPGIAFDHCLHLK